MAREVSFFVSQPRHEGRVSIPSHASARHPVDKTSSLPYRLSLRRRREGSAPRSITAGGPPGQDAEAYSSFSGGLWIRRGGTCHSVSTVSVHGAKSKQWEIRGATGWEEKETRWSPRATIVKVASESQVKTQALFELSGRRWNGRERDIRDMPLTVERIRLALM